MFNEILSALHDFAEGRTTKGGFTRLELILVRIRRDTRFNALKFDEILAKLVQKDDAGNEDFAMGISLAAKKTGCYGNDLRDAIERRLFSQSNVLSARSQYELSKLLIKCDGEFGPRQLNKLDDLRTEIPELWLDLALEPKFSSWSLKRADSGRYFDAMSARLRPIVQLASPNG